MLVEESRARRAPQGRRQAAQKESSSKRRKAAPAGAKERTRGDAERREPEQKESSGGDAGRSEPKQKESPGGDAKRSQPEQKGKAEALHAFASFQRRDCFDGEWAALCDVMKRENLPRTRVSCVRGICYSHLNHAGVLVAMKNSSCAADCGGMRKTGEEIIADCGGTRTRG